MTKMRVARTSLVIVGISLAVAWAWCGAMFLLSPQATPNWFALAYASAFLLGHLIAFCASITAAVYSVSALVRSPEIRHLRAYCITAIAVFLSVVLSLAVFALPRLS
jgi:hypothetical protein